MPLAAVARKFVFVRSALPQAAAAGSLDGSCLVPTKDSSVHNPRKESCMYEVLNEVYLQNYFKMSITFCDESNDGN